jgi:hypothetical protein
LWTLIPVSSFQGLVSGFVRRGPLQTSLADTQRLINYLDDALGESRGNLEETLKNLRASSQNLKQFTDTIKQRPHSLIGIKGCLPHTGNSRRISPSPDGPAHRIETASVAQA